VIEVRGLCKRFGAAVAVDDLSFRVEPGRVTGFLGPNGAGKTTTMRMILGLDRPDAGTATIDGLTYARLARPLRHVGALLDARAVHGSRGAEDHLRALARSNGIGRSRVAEVLDLVGLADVRRRRIRGFSLGMSQRLGVAAALLGDPPVLLFDEPVNGLDPEGIHWIRSLLRHLATEGRTVLVSSHLLSEMALTVDHVIMIGRGRLIADAATADILARGSNSYVRVLTPKPGPLSKLIVGAGGGVDRQPDRALQVSGLTCKQVGELACAAGIALHELSLQTASLESAFLELTGDSVEFRAESAALAAGSGGRR
jgi:ABC-2 type transport system ATP-binding protein